MAKKDFSQVNTGRVYDTIAAATAEPEQEAQNVVINQYKIEKLSFPIDGIYNYNVQRWTSTDGGKTFAYCGFGKYCRTEAEAQAYKKEMDAQEPGAIQTAPEPATVPDGNYYFMDCMNAFVNNGLFPAAEFKDDADAIQTAANYEATLYKYEYRHGERISSAVLYQPRFM